MNQENNKFWIVKFKRATALLVINSIILGVPALLLSDATTFFNWAMILGLLSIALLMHNYAAIYLTFSRTGQIVSAIPDDSTKDKKEQDIQQSFSRHKRVLWIENICLGILCIQSVLITLSFRVIPNQIKFL